MIKTIIEFILITSTFLAGLFTLISVNPINSIISLIIVFILSGSYLIVLSMNFIGLAYYVIYVGAISILFIFAIMMLNTKYPEFSNIFEFSYTKYFPLTIVTLIIFVFIYLNYKYNLEQLLNLYNYNILNINLNNFWNLFDYFYGKFNIIKEIENTHILWDSLIPNINQIKIIAFHLYTNYLLWLIIISLNLLLAMIGPIILCFNSYVK